MNHQPEEGWRTLRSWAGDVTVAGQLHHLPLEEDEEGGAGLEGQAGHLHLVLDDGEQLELQQVEGRGGETLLLLGGRPVPPAVQSLPHGAQQLVQQPECLLADVDDEGVSGGQERREVGGPGRCEILPRGQAGVARDVGVVLAEHVLATSLQGLQRQAPGYQTTEQTDVDVSLVEPLDKLFCLFVLV